MKQADLVLAMHLCSEAFTAGQKARNFAYYEAITVRDSSLSARTQAVVAAEVGHVELAYDYLAEAALVDLDDLAGNTGDGLHIASLAGAWSAVVAGLGGMRASPSLGFAPRLPEDLERLTFRITYRSRRVRVSVTSATASYELLDGAPIEISHYGAPVPLDAAVVELPIPPATDTAAPSQPSGRAPARRTARRHST